MDFISNSNSINSNHVYPQFCGDNFTTTLNPNLSHRNDHTKPIEGLMVLVFYQYSSMTLSLYFKNYFSKTKFLKYGHLHCDKDFDN